MKSLISLKVTMGLLDGQVKLIRTGQMEWLASPPEVQTATAIQQTVSLTSDILPSTQTILI
jgi:hypothetical protein